MGASLNGGKFYAHPKRFLRQILQKRVKLPLYLTVVEEAAAYGAAIHAGALWKELFPKNIGLTTNVGYNVDSFGHHIMLPEILKKAEWTTMYLCIPCLMRKGSECDVNSGFIKSLYDKTI